MPLNDKEIRPYLIKYLEKGPKRPNKILEELSVSYGNAIADVVAVYNTLHCFEIKGETDTVQRIQKQGIYYNKSFQKITLVTTENHINYALRYAPSYWGIILAKTENDKTVFYTIRNAVLNPDFSSEEALHTLWKEELFSIIPQNSKLPITKSMSKKNISEIISQNLPSPYIAERISTTVANRIYKTKSLYI